jgi:heme exporter protein A|tara:strand:+ start:12200 stop:12973 length:774 start_codon:yes stop_codon:yes gene_type:complete
MSSSSAALAAPCAPLQAGEPLLVAKGISCERGDKLLFDHYDLTAKSGEIVQLAGPNGAGKTTLLRSICGMFDAQIDHLSWRGIKLSSPLEYADELLYLGHKAAIRPHLTLWENLSWYTCLSQCSDMNKLAEVVAEVGLSGYELELASSLSAGQKRRIALARLKLVTCRMWILDEPFASLDADGVKMLCGWIQDFVQQGGSVVYSTHQPVDFANCDSRTLNVGQKSWASNSELESEVESEVESDSDSLSKEATFEGTT